MQNRVGPIVCRNLGRSANLSDCITVLTRGRVLAEGHYDRVSAELARPIMSRGASLGMRRNGGNGYYARISRTVPPASSRSAPGPLPTARPSPSAAAWSCVAHSGSARLPRLFVGLLLTTAIHLARGLTCGRHLHGDLTYRALTP